MKAKSQNISKYLENSLVNFAQTSRTSRQLLDEKARENDFGINLPVPRNTAASNMVMTSFWRYNNFDVNVTLIIIIIIKK